MLSALLAQREIDRLFVVCRGGLPVYLVDTGQQRPPVVCVQVKTIPSVHEAAMRTRCERAVMRLLRKRRLVTLAVTVTLVLGLFQLFFWESGFRDTYSNRDASLRDRYDQFQRMGRFGISPVNLPKHSGTMSNASRNLPSQNLTNPLLTSQKQSEHENESLDLGTAEPRLEIPMLSRSPEMEYALKTALVLGTPGTTKKFLTIGLPTVKREKANYLGQTVDSLLAALGPDDEPKVVIVIYAADIDRTYNQEVVTAMAAKFPRQLRLGLIQVITNNNTMYPDLNPSRRTFDDPVERVRWRCKQNIDAAFLFMYAANLSQYYIHLEDDVITARGFLRDIQKFVDGQRKPWVMLEFGHLGLIGKMFHCTDLPKIASCLIVFYQEQPVDLLIPYFIKIMTQEKRTFAPYSLFQHIGLSSSLKNKKQTLVDKRFKKSLYKQVPRVYDVKNPKATVTSNMEPYGEGRASDAYDFTGYVFWAANLQKGQTLRVDFLEPQPLTAVAVLTGAFFATNDYLYNGTLRYGSQDNECYDDPGSLPVGTDFRGGNALYNFTQPTMVDCLVVRVETNQTFWVVFTEIAVFTTNSTANLLSAQPVVL